MSKNIDLYEECLRWHKNAPGELSITDDGSLEIDVDGYGATLKREDFGVCGESFLAAYLFAAVSYRLEERATEMAFMKEGILTFKNAYVPSKRDEYIGTVQLTQPNNPKPRIFLCFTSSGRTEALMRAYNEYLEATP